MTTVCAITAALVINITTGQVKDVVATAQPQENHVCRVNKQIANQAPSVDSRPLKNGTFEVMIAHNCVSRPENGICPIWTTAPFATRKFRQWAFHQATARRVSNWVKAKRQLILLNSK